MFQQNRGRGQKEHTARLGKSAQILRRNKQGISKNPLKSADFRGFWSE